MPRSFNAVGRGEKTVPLKEKAKVGSPQFIAGERGGKTREGKEACLITFSYPRRKEAAFVRGKGNVDRNLNPLPGGPISRGKERNDRFFSHKQLMKGGGDTHLSLPKRKGWKRIFPWHPFLGGRKENVQREKT